jgi:hypothetical protein
VSQQRQRQRSEARSAGDAWPEPMVTRPHQTVQCAKGTEGSTVGFTIKGNKSSTRMSGAPTGRRQELPTKNVQTAPSCLGPIKGTPRRMEKHPKPPLNILWRLDSANTHLDYCDWDLSTSCVVNLLHCFLCALFLTCVRVITVILALACVSFPTLLLCFLLWSTL